MESKKLLISGASGNVGYEIIRGLHEIESPHTIIAGYYKLEKAKQALIEFSNLEYRKLDFSEKATFAKALQGIDLVFLLRPPNLADVSKYFRPFMEAMKAAEVKKIVFLSVQGAENNKAIPHHKIEQLILEHSLDYAFLRPAYFMQNLTTTLVHEIKTEGKIFIPSGKLKFNWVDVRDIGLTGAHIISDFDHFKNKTFEITGSEFEDFTTVADYLSKILKKPIRYEIPNLMKFFRHKRRLGISKPMIFVMIMLHYLPRLKKNQERLTNTVKDITGKAPNTLKVYIERDKHRFL